MDAPSRAPDLRLRFGLILVLASLVLYGRSIFFDYVFFDEDSVLLTKDMIFGRGLVEGLRAIFVDAFPREEPLLVRDVTWLLDSLVFGFANPIGYHLGNVVLNALNVGLVLLVFDRILGSTKVALAAAALYAILPVRVETVTWVMGRKDVLSTFFMLLAFLAFDSFLTESGRRRALWYVASVVMMPLALLSKISASVFFFVLLLWAPIATSRRDPGNAALRLSAMKSCIWVLPHAVLSVLVTGWYHHQLAAWGNLDRGPPFTSPDYFSVWVKLMPLSFFEYLRIFVAPFGHVIFYDYPSVGLMPSSSALIVPVLVLVFYLAATVWALLRWPLLGFCLAAYLAQMVCYANIEYIGIWIASRYLSLSSVWLLGAAALLATRLVEQRPRLAKLVPVLVGACALIYLVANVGYQGMWKDRLALYTYETSIPEPTINGFRQLASIYIEEAEATKDARRRDALVEAAADVIDRGLARYRELGVVDDPRFAIHLVHYNMHLLHYQGRVARLRGAPMAEVIRCYEQAHAIVASDELNLGHLAEAYAEWASTEPPPERARLARASLYYFAELVAMRYADPTEREQLRSRLDADYARRFPEIEGDVEALRRRFNL